MMDEKNEEAGAEEERPVSRIVVEFVGPGMADVIGSNFENITVGQMLAFAKWAEWQADRAVIKMETARQAEAEKRKAKLSQIVVPRGGLQ